MLNVTNAECHIYVPYFECCYAECHYAECRYAEYHYAECRGSVPIQLMKVSANE